MNKYILYSFALLIAICINPAAIASDTAKIIPLIKYSPDKFDELVETAFSITPNSNYLEISGDRYTLFLGERREKFKDDDSFFKSYLPKNIVSKDSIFFLSFDIDKHDRFDGFYPPKYYGVLENGKMFFFRGHDTTKYELTGLLQVEYGSIDKFREKQLERYSNLLYYENQSNGLGKEIDEQRAIDVLREDYTFYGDQSNSNKEVAVQKFLNFIRKSVVLSDAQAAIVRDYFAGGENLDKAKMIYKYYDHQPDADNCLIGRSPEKILSQILVRNEFENVMFRIKQQAQLRNTCFWQLCRLDKKKRSQEKSSNFIYYSDIEFLERIQSQVFGVDK
jgi:hypothetical protein